MELTGTDGTELEVESEATSLDFLQASTALAGSVPTRMRAAIAALPFEHPKRDCENVFSFASQLESRRHGGVGKSNVIDAKANHSLIETDPSRD